MHPDPSQNLGKTQTTQLFKVGKISTDIFAQKIDGRWLGSMAPSERRLGGLGVGREGKLPAGGSAGLVALVFTPSRYSPRTLPSRDGPMVCPIF